MTAKQLRAKLIEQIVAGNADSARVLLMQYESQLCLEQREICANEYRKDDSPDSWITIYESPMPEI